MSVLKSAQYNIINYGIDIGNNFLGYAVLTRNWLWDAMIDLNTNTDCNWKIDLKPLKEWRAYSTYFMDFLQTFSHRELCLIHQRLLRFYTYFQSQRKDKRGNINCQCSNSINSMEHFGSLFCPYNEYHNKLWMLVTFTGFVSTVCGGKLYINFMDKSQRLNPGKLSSLWSEWIFLVLFIWRLNS